MSSFVSLVRHIIAIFGFVFVYFTFRSFSSKNYLFILIYSKLRRKFEFVVQGRFLKPVPFSSIYTGQVHNRFNLAPFLWKLYLLFSYQVTSYHKVQLSILNIHEDIILLYFSRRLNLHCQLLPLDGLWTSSCLSYQRCRYCIVLYSTINNKSSILHLISYNLNLSPLTLLFHHFNATQHTV